jgi:hypothetical protein
MIGPISRLQVLRLKFSEGRSAVRCVKEAGIERAIARETTTRETAAWETRDVSALLIRCSIE